MIKIIIASCILLLVFSSCNNSQNADALAQKEKALLEKELELTKKELELAKKPDVRVSLNQNETSSKSATNDNSYGIDLVFVQGGTFEVGCFRDKKKDPWCDNCSSRPNTRCRYRATLSDFYIGKYEVTQAQWLSLMPNNPSIQTCLNCPIDNISQSDITDFLRRLSKKTGKTFRLPTSTEWEYAARGGNQSRDYCYSGSNDLDKVAWHDSDDRDENGNTISKEVGLKQPNELGIYDMSGNASELCSDFPTDDDIYRQQPINPQGISKYDEDMQTTRYLLGGMSNSLCPFGRVSYGVHFNDRGDPNKDRGHPNSNRSLGLLVSFRVVMEP